MRAHLGTLTKNPDLENCKLKFLVHKVLGDGDQYSSSYAFDQFRSRAQSSLKVPDKLESEKFVSCFSTQVPCFKKRQGALVLLDGRAHFLTVSSTEYCDDFRDRTLAGRSPSGHRHSHCLSEAGYFLNNLILFNAGCQNSDRFPVRNLRTC